MKITTKHIQLDRIVVEERLRELDEAHVAEIVESVEKHGFLDALWVRERTDGNYKLLAGRHRLAAAHKIGVATIRCDVWERTGDMEDDKDDDLIAEVAENLMRKELEYSERSDQGILAAAAEETQGGSGGSQGCRSAGRKGESRDRKSVW